MALHLVASPSVCHPVLAVRISTGFCAAHPRSGGPPRIATPSSTSHPHPGTQTNMPLNTPGNALLLISILSNIFAGTCGTFSEEGQWCSKRGAIGSLALAAVIQAALTLYDRAYGVEQNPEKRTWAARATRACRLNIFTGIMAVVFVSVVVVTCFFIQTLGHGDYSRWGTILMWIWLPALGLYIFFYFAIRFTSRKIESRDTLDSSPASQV